MKAVRLSPNEEVSILFVCSACIKLVFSEGRCYTEKAGRATKGPHHPSEGTRQRTRLQVAARNKRQEGAREASSSRAPPI